MCFFFGFKKCENISKEILVTLEKVLNYESSTNLKYKRGSLNEKNGRNETDKKSEKKDEYNQQQKKYVVK